jgi:hypothetical protein
MVVDFGMILFKDRDKFDMELKGLTCQFIVNYIAAKMYCSLIKRVKIIYAAD